MGFEPVGFDVVGDFVVGPDVGDIVNVLEFILGLQPLPSHWKLYALFTSISPLPTSSHESESSHCVHHIDLIIIYGYINYYWI